ncbi:piggyBac transposable element-derived protein 4-like [Trematomus bernacchii]|uniref:piggyBac transposable element-derived protein 4-like n=1 Tax=Trematomus bernacchii TaxID=40690 RepID=UPI00146D5A61|nr:piggyBac transposable element-derived protein 4-like [Trematomus bernacchii]
MPPRKRLYKLEDAVEMVFADSPSEDEDLLDLPQSDPDYELRESEYDEYDMASGSQPSTSASSELRRASDQHTVAPEPSTSKLRRRMSAPVLTQPPSASSDSEPSFELPSKRKASKKAVNPRKRGRGRGRSSSSRTTEEELGWHNKEDNDETPEPLRFMPARVPGPALDTTAQWSPLQLFKLFFSHAVVHTIIANTNTKALYQLQAGKKYPWKVLTFKDFYIFLSIVIFTGLVIVPNQADYWRTSFPYNFKFPGDTMSRQRFHAILWSLHMSDPKEDEENDRKRNTAEYDRLFKIKPLYTEITAACKAHFQPHQNISIDERMVASKARISLKQYMKNKPTKWGYKLFVLADSSMAYTWNFFVYTGKSEFLSGQGLSYSSVVDLLPFPLLGGGYTLFVDNFYTSPALFGDLFAKNIGCCGTIRKNRVGFPQTELNDLPKKAERGDMRWIRRSKLLFIKWMDSREVTMCSTVHAAFSGQTVRRNVKRAGVWQTKIVTVPDAVVDYNRSMGGVDVSDALIGYYSVLRKTMKWYKTFFYHFLDIAVVNSFILYKELHKMRVDVMNPHTQKSFREQLCAELRGDVPAAPPPLPPSSQVCMPAYYGEDATALRRYCRRCSEAGNKTVKTPIYCTKCLIPLCLTSKKNCFKAWHTSD